MISLSSATRVFVYSDHIDFRSGLDGIIGLTKRKIKEDPMSGALFVFRNRKCTSFKAIIYDGQGYWLMMKRLSDGKFRHWPKQDDTSLQMLAREAMVLMWNGNPQSAQMLKDWRSIDDNRASQLRDEQH